MSDLDKIELALNWAMIDPDCTKERYDCYNEALKILQEFRDGGNR